MLYPMQFLSVLMRKRLAHCKLFLLLVLIMWCDNLNNIITLLLAKLGTACMTNRFHVAMCLLSNRSQMM